MKLSPTQADTVHTHEQARHLWLSCGQLAENQKSSVKSINRKDNDMGERWQEQQLAFKKEKGLSEEHKWRETCCLMTKSPKILTDGQAAHKQMGARAGQERTRTNNLVKISICSVKHSGRGVKTNSTRRSI